MMDERAQDKRIKHFSALTGVAVNLFCVKEKNFKDFSATFCSKCPHPCDYAKTHLYGCYESVRWDNKYVYYCPMDLTFVAVPLYDEYSILTEGVTIGPIIMGESTDYEQTYGLPQMETSKVNDLMEIASALFCEKEKKASVETADFLNTVYKELELMPKDGSYPIELENNLCSAISEGNEQKAREYLNRLLGEIFFRSGGDFNTIKTRALELVVLLSRSAIEGGADSTQIFNLSNKYAKEADGFSTLEELSMWLSELINRLIGYAFDLKDVRHSVTIRRIAGFIRNNYMRKITLDDIASEVYMSKSHVSKIFNEEMGTSITAFINGVRVDKAKILLRDASLSVADVASLTGFEDQSYFAKQFKLITGVSPKKFREKQS